MDVLIYEIVPQDVVSRKPVDDDERRLESMPCNSQIIALFPVLEEGHRLRQSGTL